MMKTCRRSSAATTCSKENDFLRAPPPHSLLLTERPLRGGSLAALVKLAGRRLDEGHSQKTPPAAQLMRTREEQLRWLRPR